MRNTIYYLMLLCIWYGILTPQNHPRARAAITAIHNQLPQLQSRYDPNVAQSIQYYIDLLRQLEPAEADKYQQQLNTLIPTRSTTPVQPSSRTRPAAPPVPRPVISRPPIDLPPALPQTVPAPPSLAKPVQPPIPSIPRPPFTAPPADMPPAPPAPTDVPRPPVPCAPVACTPDVEAKKQLAQMQQRAMQVLQKFVPRVKNQSLDDSKKILLDNLRVFILELSRKNTEIKKKTIDINHDNRIVQRAVPIDFDLTIKAYDSINHAIDLCELVYGFEAFEQLRDYFKEIRTEFHTVTYAYAQALVDSLFRMKDSEIPSIRDAITSEQEIGHALRVAIDMGTTVHVFAMIHLPRMLLITVESSVGQKQLIKRMLDLFDVLQHVLVETRNAFDQVQGLPEPLKITQKDFYSLMSSVITAYIDGMPIDVLTATQKKNHSEMVQTSINYMNGVLLKMRVGQK